MKPEDIAIGLRRLRGEIPSGRHFDEHYREREKPDYQGHDFKNWRGCCNCGVTYEEFLPRPSWQRCDNPQCPLCNSLYGAKS